MKISHRIAWRFGFISTYMQPDVAILEMELEQMVAASDGYVDVDDGTSDDPENADSRLFFESDDVM